MEKEAVLKRRKDYLQQAVLSAIGIAGILAVGLVAPNTLQLLGKITSRRFPYQTTSVLSRLAKKGYVRIVLTGGKKYVEITSLGQRALDVSVQKNILQNKQKRKWDKRWRMVLFDIPERRKKDRDYLRRTMIEAGFLCFQDSVWVFPYDCEELITLLKIERRYGNAVRYAIVEKLENDSAVKRYFKL